MEIVLFGCGTYLRYSPSLKSDRFGMEIIKFLNDINKLYIRS